MKNIFTFAVVALISMATLVGCTKSSTTTSYSMVAVIGGGTTTFNNSLLNVTYNAVTGVNTYVIQGLNNEKNYPYIYIYFPKKDTGNFTLGGYPSSAYAIYAVDTLTIKYSVSGTLRIDSLSPVVKGSYNFTCADGTTITAGVFRAKPLP